MVPFVRLILPAGLGILLVFLTGLRWEYAAVCCVVMWVSAWYFVLKPGRGYLGIVYPWLAVLFFFACAASLMSPVTGGLPDGGYIYAEVVLAEEPVESGRWIELRGNITAYRNSESSDGWNETGFGVQLYLDSACVVSAGDRLLVKGYFNAFNPDGGSYEALMARRRISGRMYITSGSLLASDGGNPGFISSLHARAVRKMSLMPGDRDEVSVAAAMVSGDKRQVPRDTRAAYRKGGGAHLLAVSGLHVGIVFVIVNLLLYFMPVIRRGHIAKNILAVAAVWLFAAAAGLSPSVVRAALMFSFVQFALAGGTNRHALNVIAASAFVMLAVNPNYFADPSFVLSYVAVLAIILFFGPVYGLLKTRSRIINGLVSVYAVGIIASLAVAPFVSYWFGSVPLAGIIVNPIVILTAHIIVGVGALWLVWPFGFGGAVFGWVTGIAVAVQDAVMRWCASLEWSGIGVRIPLWTAVVIYGLIIFSSGTLRRYVESRRNRLILPNDY